MFWAVLSVFIASAVIPFTRYGKGPITGWIYALLPAGLTVFFASKIPALLDGPPLHSTHAWFPSLGISLSFCLDMWSVVFILLITGIGTLITIYSAGYLEKHPQKKYFFCFLFMFMASMLGTVLSNNAILLFVFWELTSLSSYFLIGFNNEEEMSRRNALQALLVTGTGGLAMLAGFVMIGQIAGSFEITHWILQGEMIRSHALLAPALILILLGAFTKSAQFPFHFWLPNAMVAPTPVSAYLHSSTMVKAGVYLLARLFPIFGVTAIWQSALPWVGGLTIITGIFMALRVNDLKLHLAYLTVSALGILVLLIGTGTPFALYAAVVFFIAHAFYKGSLFMAAGSIHHGTGTRDPEKLSGLWKKMPVTALTSLLAGASLASIPPFLGFSAKEMALGSIIENYASWILPIVLLLSGIVFTAIALWVALKPFAGKPHDPHAHEVSFSMWIGGAVLATLGLGMALSPAMSLTLFWERAVSSITAVPVHLGHSQTHATSQVFLWTVAAWIGGLLLFFKRLSVRAFFNQGAKAFRLLEPDHLYQNCLNGLATTAKAQTHFLQSGSLRYYFRIVIVTMIVLSAAGFARAGWPGLHISRFYFFETFLAVLIVASTIATIFTQEKLSAIAYLGIVGLAISLIFFLFGAPDLAITQFAVEVLTLILLALVLYRLPHFNTASSKRTLATDAIISILAGVSMFVFVLYAASLKEGIVPSIARFYMENSEKLAHGRNIVNVILVDFRGFDTLGEITVLAIAGIGAYSLLKLVLDSKKEPR